MVDVGFASAEAARAAKAEPLVLSKRLTPRPAPHFVSAIEDGVFDGATSCDTRHAAPLSGDVVEVETTIDSTLQQEAETLARATVRGLERQDVSAASVVVLDNATGDVLAWVGSPDVADTRRLGGNDGVRALRQPGSSLKPFVYELGMERLAWSPATMFADVATSFASPDGSVFRPQNYDEKFHGPVLLRDALGNSFNIPAVSAAEQIGVGPLLERLHSLGFCSLSRPASEYGLALALGDGEVRLVDLANAYATLARGGDYLPVRAVRSTTRWDGARVESEPAAPRRLLDPSDAFMITDVLEDRSARLSSFGEGSALELPFPVAAKTGTSKGYRDNIAVGYTSRVTVAVWVGNFDGSPMKAVSGITGAGPLFQQVMRAAEARYPSAPIVEPAGVERVEVCALSGDAPGPDCPHHRRDVDRSGHRRHACSMHVRAQVDHANGLLAGAKCTLNDVDVRVFEVYPPALSAWARDARRDVLPEASSPRCPTEKLLVSRAPRISFPEDGARFHIDPASASPSAIRIRGEAPEGATLTIDGVPHPFDAAGIEWILVQGAHTLELTSPASSKAQTTIDGDRTDIVRFTVD